MNHLGGGPNVLARAIRVIAPLHSRVSIIASVFLGKISAQQSLKRYETEVGFSSTSEADNHADTCVAGANMLALEATGEVCEVQGYSSELGTIKDVPIVRAATAWTHPETGETIILIFNQILWYGNRLPISLINPNQLRHNGYRVSDDVTDGDRFFGIELDDDARLPFDMEGTRISFESRVPTAWEMNNENCRHYVVTCDHPWDPSVVKISATQSKSRMETSELRSLTVNVSSVQVEESNRSLSTHRCLSNISNTLDDRNFTEKMISQVNVISVEPPFKEEEPVMGGPPRVINSINSETRHSSVTPEEVSRKFRCGIETAKKTIEKTTQRGIRRSLNPLHRRYRTYHPDLHRNQLNVSMSSDTLFAKVKSLQGNTCAHLYTTGKFTKIYPLPDKTAESVGGTLLDVLNNIGVPKEMVTDLGSEMVGRHTTFRKELIKRGIPMRNAEKGRHGQNGRAELEIDQVKRRWKDLMVRKKVPSRLWDYALVWISEILSHLARGKDGIPGIEELTGQTADISEWLDFDFYDLVWYHENQKTDMTTESVKLGRWLGVAHCVGSDMCYWILTKSGQVISTTTVQHVTRLDTTKPEIAACIELFHEAVNRRLDDTNFQLEDNVLGLTLDDIDNVDGPRPVDVHIPTDAEYGDMKFDTKPDMNDDDGEEYFDKYIGAEITVQRGDATTRARVKKRARDSTTGDLLGKRHNNPYMSTAVYDIEFPDGEIESYGANLVAENLYSQCDDEGNMFLVMEEISDHKRGNDAIPIQDGFVQSKNGNEVPKRTTRGWQLLVEWKDGASDWIPLKDLKDSNPVELAEYAVANGIDREPAFYWWVPHVLKKRNRIISKLKKRYWRTTHKFGVRVPKTVDDALEIDANEGNTIWFDSLKKELSKIMIAFNIKNDITPEMIRGDSKLLPGFQEIKCHWVFDVKMDLTRKSRFVAGGHMTTTPVQTYSSVVSRDSVRLAFLIAALNGLDLQACDVGNAYLNAECREKIWFVAGPEFGEHQGKVIIVVRALYGLKSSGAAWRKLLQDMIIGELDFTPSKADRDVYIRPAVAKDGFEYYEMILVYVDDLLILSEDASKLLKLIDAKFKLKPDSIGPPTTYLGAQVEPFTLPDGVTVWSMSARKYVKESIRNVRQMLMDDGGLNLPACKSSAPIPTDYRPELDVSRELDDQMASRYQQLIGVLRWMVEIGRVDILHEVSIMSQYLAMPREGHLDKVYGIFSYLAKHENSRLVFDDKDPKFADGTFKRYDWSDIYGDNMNEDIPADMPAPRGRSVIITMFVDANHAGNVVTRRSHSGILIFVQNAPILFYSKRQNSVETSTFGSEFVALRVGEEMIEGLRYKLRMFGVPINGPAKVLCDNEGVVKNASIPESALNKKANAINYNKVREAVAKGIIEIGKEDGQTNLADLFTKVIAGIKRKLLLKGILW
jgi:hypothetical protein